MIKFLLYKMLMNFQPNISIKSKTICAEGASYFLNASFKVT